MPTGAELIPNILAYIALFGWPAVCIVLFAMLPLEVAAIASLLGGYLLVPTGVSVDIQYLMPLDKTTITTITVFVLCLIKGGQAPATRQSLLIYLFALAFILSPIFTAANNSYELQAGGRSLPGFYPVDALKLALTNVVTLLPFFIGKRVLASDRGRMLLLKALPLSLLLYSLPMLFEIRMSPQIQKTIYGTDPAGFITLARGGGFRPLVFLSNGLELALFTSMALIAAAVALRLRMRLFQVPPAGVVAYLGALLLLCKSLGSILTAAVFAPLVFFTKPRTWVLVSCVVGVVLCAYPLLRNYDLIPVRRIAAVTAGLSTDRSGSFKFRVKNEDQLLAKANEKAMAGWGTWGRNRIYDSESGKDLSITDGAWIIRFGMFGWLGYLSFFGLFACAMFSAIAGVRGPVTPSTILLGGLTLILALNLIDLIPNASLTPITFVLAGAIAGRVLATSSVAARYRLGRTRNTAIPKAREIFS